MMDKRIQESIKALTDDDWVWMFENFVDNHHQVFTFTSCDTGETLHIDVTRLQNDVNEQKVKNAQFRMMGLTEDLYMQILRYQGIELEHLKNISCDDAAYDPALILEDNTEHIVVDGNHKIVKAYDMGLRRRPAIFIPRADVEPYYFRVPERVSAVMQACTACNVQFASKLVESVYPVRTLQ